MADDASPSRLLLASCHSQHYAHVPVKDNIWDAMRLRNASGLLWVGDAIYGDDYDEQHHVVPATPAVLQSLYQELLHDNAGYRRFRDDATMTVLGVWDDHDYGVNNGDRHYQFRIESAAMFLDFLRRSNRRTDLLDLSIMERRAQAGRGLYGVKVLDFRRPRGQELLSDHEAGVEPEVSPLDAMSLSDRSVAVFLIDCRSNKTPWQKKNFADTFSLDYEGDFLGEEQWQWLETALQRSTATVNLIVQGLQVHADR
jgi:alkaline phosphatase D